MIFFLIPCRHLVGRCVYESEQTGKLNQIRCKIKKETKRGVEGQRGSHNLPQYIAASKVMKECSNIPMYIKVIHNILISIQSTFSL